MKLLHWFRNDLRIHDHRILGKMKNVDHFIPLYVIDPSIFQKMEYGFPKTDYYRYQFLMESLADLKESLKFLKSDLIIRIGKPNEVINEIVSQYEIDLVTFQKEFTYEEIVDEKLVEESVNVEVKSFQGKTLFHPADIPMEIERIPDVFTSFRKKCEKYGSVREEIPTPNSLPPLPEGIESEEIPTTSIFGLEVKKVSKKTAFPFNGGESEALLRLKDYVYERKLINSYKYTRNQLIGESFSSKFSPWLANGSLSPRKIYWTVKNFEKDNGSNISTYWLIFELIWRDYFQYVAMKYGKRIFYKSGIKGKSKKFLNRKNDFQNWMNGTTGEPFVDANMIELKETGWMSNRGRQNVASFLCNDLSIDWRWGASWFESQLIDYDVCSNWGNWMYVAGVGNDPRENRYFNIKKQMERYDPKMEYVNLWLDEN